MAWRSAAVPVPVWVLDLDALAGSIGTAADVLSDDERARAARFQFDRDRRWFVLTRAALRSLVARHAGCVPADVGFSYGEHGRPRLSQPECSLCFSVAHSGGVGVIAMTAGAPVGVDVERVRATVNAGDLSRRFFAAEERGALDALDGTALLEAFFRTWTRKEAVLKATGLGMAAGLDAVAVVDRPGGPDLVRSRLPMVEPAAWSVHDLALGDGIAAAVAVGAPTIRTRLHHVSLDGCDRARIRIVADPDLAGGLSR